MGRRVLSSDKGVNGFLHQVFLELGPGQLTPHSRLIALLCKLIGSVQVSNVLNQDLGTKEDLEQPPDIDLLWAGSFFCPKQHGHFNPILTTRDQIFLQ